MITTYRITSTRVCVSPYVPGTSAGGWRDAREAVYDHPWRDAREVIADFDAGRPTPGDEVEKTVVGVGTTVRLFTRWSSRGWDDGDDVCYATYRDDAGEWHDYAYGDAGRLGGNRAVVDASPEVMAAYAAHLAAEDARRRAEEAARAERDRLARERRERATVDRGRFVLVARGRKVPVGTVGQVFVLAAGEYGERAGVATSTRTEPTTSQRGRVYQRAVDSVWTATANLDVLLTEMPDASTPTGRRETEALYRYAAHVASWAAWGEALRVRAANVSRTDTDEDMPEEEAPLVDTFSALWREAWSGGDAWRLAVLSAWTPAELDAELRLDADTPRTLADIVEVVEGSGDVRGALSSIVASTTAAARDGGDDGAAIPTADDIRGAARSLVRECLGVVYTPAPKAKRSRKPAAKTAAA